MKGFGDLYKSKKKINKQTKSTQKQIISKAIQFHLKGNIQEAAKYYQKLISEKCKDERVFSNYAIILQSLNKLEAASKFYHKAIEINPDFADAHSNLGKLLIDLEEPQAAELHTRKAIEINPDFADAHYNLGIILHDINKPQEAKISFRKAIKLNPDFANAHYNLGSVLSDIGKHQEAVLSYRKAIKLNPDFANAHYNLGILLSDIGKHQEAELSYRKAIEINPDFAPAHLNLGILFKDLGNLKKAEISLRKAIEINPDFAKAYFVLSLFIIPKANDYLITNLFSEEILKSKDNLEKTNKADIYFARGNILERKKDYKESFRMFRIANLITRKKFKSNFTSFKESLNRDNSYILEIKNISYIEDSLKDLPTPIFTVGLPRSGKSTVESILSKNNLVKNFGDRKGISEVIRDYKNIEIAFKRLGISIYSTYKEIRMAYLKLAKQYHPDKGGDKNMMAQIAEGYNFLKSEYKNKSKDYTRPNLYEFFLQKLDTNLDAFDYTSHTSPNNILYTGLIAYQMPQSKIIYCYRNPKDHIVELYKYNLQNYLTLKTSVIDLSKIMVIINSQMEEYRNKLKNKIYFLNYDQLIKDPKREIKSLIKWLKWEYDEKYLTPQLIPQGSIESKNDFKNFNSSYLNKSINYMEMLKPVERILSKII